MSEFLGINKALEGVTPSAWRITGTMPSGSRCWKVVEHEHQARIEALDWKQYSIVDVSPLYDFSTLESLQRENKELRADNERLAEEAGYDRTTRASTGGEDHAE